MTEFLQALQNRRSIYALSRETTVSAQEMVQTIQTAVQFTPTAFNSQTTRVLMLFGKEHEKLWELTKTTLKEEMRRQGASETAFEATEKKLLSFAKGIGTALFFEDVQVVRSLQEKFPLYAKNFPIWAEQASGIATANAWVALSELGLGANLQHYNPVIDESVANTWQIPAHWLLRGQLVFGGIAASAGEKTFIQDEERFRVCGLRD